MTEKRRKLKYTYVDPSGYGWKLALLAGLVAVALLYYLATYIKSS